jgi:uncharacterized protein (DUF488 family)
MSSVIFTIGFTKKTAEEFFRLLREAQVQKVIDVRENRGGQLAGFAKYPDLAFFLGLLGITYDYQPIFAPSLKIRTAYRKTRDWAQYEKSFSELMEQRKVLEQANPNAFQGSVALLCSESTPEKCHRRLVAEMLAKHWNALGLSFEVKHLTIERPRTPRKRRSEAHGGANPI